MLLLISETRDHGSHIKTDAVVSAIGQANTLMYALAFSPSLSNILDTGRGTNKNEMHHDVDFLDLGYRMAQAMRKNVPSTVALMTGGEYELFATRKKFDVRMNDFTNHLHSRYLLSIAPRNPHPGLHQIRVRLKDPAEWHGARQKQLLGGREQAVSLQPAPSPRLTSAPESSTSRTLLTKPDKVKGFGRNQIPSSSTP